jgi:hypothetical protein
MFKFIRQFFQLAAAPDLGGPVLPSTATGPVDPEPTGDDDTLIGRRGNTPVFLGGKRSVIPRLRPVIVRRPRSSAPIPVEQGPRGPASERKHFEELPGPMVKPRAAGRGLPVLEGPPRRQPYGLEPGEEDPSGAPEGRVRADRAMGLAPYGLGPRQLTG